MLVTIPDLVEVYVKVEDVASLAVVGLVFPVFLTHLQGPLFQLLADRGHQGAQTLQRLIVLFAKQVADTLMHDPWCEHFELIKLSDEYCVS